MLFGFDFGDKTRWSVRQNFPVYRSEVLESLWEKGNSEIGSVTFESAAYVARYVVKKFKSGDAQKVKEYYGNREPEFCLMSRRPGIGKAWFDKYKAEVMKHDSVMVGGREVKPSGYYDAEFAKWRPKEFAA